MTDLVTLDTIELRGSEIVATVRFPANVRPGTTFFLLARGDGPFAGTDD